MRPLAATVACVLVAAAFQSSRPRPAQAEPRVLRFGEAVERAVARHPEVAGAKLAAEDADLRTHGARSQRYPRLRADANLLRWDRPLFIDLMAAPAMPGMGAGDGPQRLVVRDRYTSLLSLTLSQPISGLLVLHHMVAMEEAGGASARAEQARARLDVAFRAAEAYLRLLQAAALEESAVASEKRVDAQLERARALERGGVLGPVDVLRWIANRDQARQVVVRARADRATARDVLAVLLDFPLGEIDVVDDLPDPPQPVVVVESDLTGGAVEDLPELARAKSEVERSRRGSTVALSQMLPNLMAVGTYQHVEGQGPFQPRNAWYIGATLTWEIWDWGKTWDEAKGARVRQAQAELAVKSARDRMALETRRRLLEARAAYETLAPARSALAAAEEAHRIQDVRYAAGASNTSEVIDTETELRRAQVGYAQARYDYYLAQAALARAVGRLPALSPAR